MKDRFSEATMELDSKSPFICTDCETTYGHPTISHLGGAGGHDPDHDWRGPECTYNCDPMPFGD